MLSTGVSLLERLMNNFPVYQKNADDVFNSCFVTKLLRNYRCARRESLRMLGNEKLKVIA